MFAAVIACTWVEYLNDYKTDQSTKDLLLFMNFVFVLNIMTVKFFSSLFSFVYLLMQAKQSFLQEYRDYDVMQLTFNPGSNSSFSVYSGVCILMRTR